MPGAAGANQERAEAGASQSQRGRSWPRTNGSPAEARQWSRDNGLLWASYLTTPGLLGLRQGGLGSEFLKKIVGWAQTGLTTRIFITGRRRGLPGLTSRHEGSNHWQRSREKYSLEIRDWNLNLKQFLSYFSFYPKHDYIYRNVKETSER